MSKDPITITWDELKTRTVDRRIDEQQALARNRAYAKLNPETLPAAKPARTSLLNNTMAMMVILGLLGAGLAWGCGFLTGFKPAEQDALDTLQAIGRIEMQRADKVISAAQADGSQAELREESASNPYFKLLDQSGLTDQAREVRLAQIRHRAELKRSVQNAMSFGLSGLFLALCLGVAEPLSERNVPRAVRNGAVGAALGLVGGIAVWLFIDRLFRAASGTAVAAEAGQFTPRQVLARAVSWGVLGLFLTAAPGLVIGNLRKTLAGMAGGLLGGLIGGLLFEPLNAAAGPDVSRLVALAAIGLVSGTATGLIENAAKTGWLKVTAGLIAGKQFILYRNPTFIGSAPDCQIYLFRDPNIGRRHAAIHLVPGGVELEDLPLGQVTLVNEQPVSRVRLHHGDQITVGGTQFLFQEKVKGEK